MTLYWKNDKWWYHEFEGPWHEESTKNVYQAGDYREVDAMYGFKWLPNTWREGAS